MDYFKDKKIALVHYWLTGMRGGEKVVQSICNVYPEIDIFTLVYNREKIDDSINNHNIYTSFIQRFPFSRNKYQMYLPFMPVAVEQFDLSKYDIVISSESGIAKGVITKPQTCHICYVHSPMRYLWNMYFDYMQNERMGFLKKNFIKYYFNYLRVWDYATAARVDYFACNSNNVRRRILKYYNREAKVIYPPVDIDRFKFNDKKKDYFLIVSQLVSYKRIDIAVKAFNELGRELVVIGDGPEFKALNKIANKNIIFLGWQPDDRIVEYYSDAKAFIFPGEEDFGITPVEAQASGTPVVGYAKGGLLETVIDGKTGILFKKQEVDELKKAVLELESRSDGFDYGFIRENSLRFRREIFESQFSSFVEKKYSEYNDIYMK